MFVIIRCEDVAVPKEGEVVIVEVRGEGVSVAMVLSKRDAMKKMSIKSW